MQAFRDRPAAPVPPASVEDLWNLYALGRVLEELVLRFQTGESDGSPWQRPSITAAEFEHFATGLGLTVMWPTTYTPFHHEVVEATPSWWPRRSVEVAHLHWPCVMLGPLLLMRAGATVVAHSRVLCAGIADRSTLFWAYRRNHRQTSDLSHGWGSNSSWRTAFRRDYHQDGQFLFNADGPLDLSELPAGTIDENGLSVPERISLLVNRSFVVDRCHKDHAWPFDDRWCEPEH